MPNTSPKSTTLAQVQQTTMMSLQQCLENNAANLALVNIENNLSVPEVIKSSPLICTEGSRKDVVKQIIRIIEYFLKIVGKEMEAFQIQILAADLYDRFKTDTVDDIIILFKMARKGEFGKVYKIDNFEVMRWVDEYLLHKSAEREKLIEKKKNNFKKKSVDTVMSDEAYAKFTELQKRISDPIKKRAETFSISKALQSLDGYLDNLDETSQKLSDNDLKFEIIKAQNTNKQAWEILILEQERRKQLKKEKK